MNLFHRRAACLAFAGALALAGCQGSKGDAGQNGTNGAGGPTGPTGPTGPGGNPGLAGASTGVNVEVVSVSTTSPITVRFKLKDDRGFPVDAAGVYSVNTVFGAAGSSSGLRFSLAFTSTDANGNVLPYTVLTNSGAPAQPTGFSPYASSRGPGVGTLIENGSGAGDYTYTFPDTSVTGGAQAVAYDTTKLSNTHVLWIQATRQTNLDYPDDPKGFTSVNKDHWFVPAGGTPVKRELVKTSNCSNCHRGFKPGEGSIAASTFHGGGMVDATLCGICHNPGRVSNAAAEAKVYLHRIHNSENLQPANLFHGIKIAFPQDIRNCDACHAGAAQGAQAKGNPTRAACGSCHDYVSFTAAGAAACVHPPAKDASGVNLTCNHQGGQRADDSACTGCHAPSDISGYHLTVAPPDANNIYLNPSGVPYTNAASIAAANALPAGAKRITYEVATVDTVVATGGFNPRIKFRFLVNGTPTPMQTFAAGTTEEIFAGFVGAPSVYFAWGVPQDGINAPADFNASASAYIRNVWNGKVTTATLTGPDASQFYTITLNNVIVPATATKLTGGVGYTYSLGTASASPPFSNNTLPLTQIDLAAYPYTPNACPAPGTAGNCGGTGGLIVPAPDVWKVADGFVGRRAIVDNAKCQTCHVALGAAPTFHAGQRNDAPSCSFCHDPNRTSSGWSATAKNFIHSLHAARIRTVPFMWHASTPAGFSEVEFPGALNNCTACHVNGGFNFTALAGTTTSGTATVGKKGSTVCTVSTPCTCTTSSPCTGQTDSGASALPNLLPSTVATGTYTIPAAPAINTISPYVDGTGATNYGAGFSYNASTGATTQAAGTTLVNSPITAACTGCHDSPMAVDHMQTNGGKFYEVRSTALAAGAPLEQCMICHGPNTIAPIADVHK